MKITLKEWLIIIFICLMTLIPAVWIWGEIKEGMRVKKQSAIDYVYRVKKVKYNKAGAITGITISCLPRTIPAKLDQKTYFKPVPIFMVSVFTDAERIKCRKGKQIKNNK